MYQYHPIIQVFCSVFFAVLFLQSGTDKMIDRAGNIEYIRGQFAGSPMEKFSTALLTLLTIMEILCGLTCLAGAMAILFYRGNGNFILRCATGII
jgi:uncharacterized membrane protein YphA (DoxX/SURF4 family)